MLEVKPDLVVKVPDEVARVLKKFIDVMPPELAKHHSPQQVINNKLS